MGNCPFCQPQNFKSRVLRESEHSRVILSSPRLMPGHTLVIPRRHLEKPWELRPQELQEIFQNIWWAEQKLLASHLATGCDIRQNYRPFLPQSKIKVDHLHFHILPRTDQDELFQTSLRFEKTLFAELTLQEETSIAKLFTL